MIDLVRAGRTPEALARAFEPSAQTIRNWVTQADRDSGRRSDGPSSAEQEELRRLRQEVKRLREAREFAAERPDEVYVADITYVPTWAGFLYLAAVLDTCTRRVVGWAMATHLRTELVVDALEMALMQRRPEGVIHHSDQGCQYTSLAFGERCRAAGVRPSMGSVGDCYDNAMAESFFATLECELLARHRFRDQAEARRAVFEFIEGWYNPHRRHSAIGYHSPINYERRLAKPEIPAKARNRPPEAGQLHCCR